jgi:quercetin dioxygenase-like cupin family protein
MVEAHAGRVIENPVSHERIVVRASGTGTAGRLLAFELYLPPGAHVPARHVHPIQEERFTVVGGRMRFRLGGRSVEARAGETVVVPPGRAHWFGNAGEEPAHAWVEVRPALRMEEFLAASEAIAGTGRLPGTRLPRLTDLAAVLLEFQREVAVPNVPAVLVWAILAPLAWLARRHRPGARAVGG